MQARNRKLCSRCLKLKPLADFAEGQNRGRWCRDCYLAYFRTYNAKRYSSPQARALELERGRVKYATVIKAQRMERKRRLVVLMGGKCSLCGYSKSAAALDFDHLTHGRQTKRGATLPSKARTISHLLAMNRPGAFELALAEARKCRLICANCHREQTFPGHNLNEQQNPERTP